MLLGIESIWQNSELLILCNWQMAMVYRAVTLGWSSYLCGYSFCNLLLSYVRLFVLNSQRNSSGWVCWFLQQCGWGILSFGITHNVMLQMNCTCFQVRFWQAVYVKLDVYCASCLHQCLWLGACFSTDLRHQLYYHCFAWLG